jgi:hypothetical protein
MPSYVLAIMHDCLVAEPEKRPTLNEIASRVKRFEVEDVEPKGLVKKVKKVKPGEKNFELLLKLFPRHIGEAL